MIETDAQTEADLREAVRLATSYAIDSLGPKTREELEKIPREHFVARCHEGFDLAQKLILKNLLPQSKKIANGEQPASPEECSIYQFLSDHKDLFTDRHKQKQVERVVRQMDRMHSVLEYDQLNIGKDISLTVG
jgi:hypothetical protein